jgi:predicted nuclease of predicted toxin-antitoxin system
VVLALALEQEAVLITENKDFGELTVRLAKPNKSIILIRTEPMPMHIRCELIIDLIGRYGEQLKECLTVIDGNGRVRLGQIARR